MPPSRDSWNPDQYERFRDERSAPFFDLLALVRPRPAMNIVDLGCGTGELTRQMHDRWPDSRVLGIDSSAAMLEKAAGLATDGLTFARGTIEAFAPPSPPDLIISNAAIHWVDDHEALIGRFHRQLSPQGQLAIQIPANHDHPSHLVAAEIAGRGPFRNLLNGYIRRSPVLAPDAYAEILHRAGFREQHVRLVVYAHLLPDRDAVVEWVKGTLLTTYQSRLSADAFEQFLAEYRIRLREVLEEARPYFYPFKRILMWAAK